MNHISDGDVFTIAGVYKIIRNPDRHWWQIWRPRMVATGKLQTFRVRQGVGVDLN